MLFKELILSTLLRDRKGGDPWLTFKNPALSHFNHGELMKNYPSNFLFLRMGLFTECRGLRLTFRSWILMLANCSA